MKKKEKGMISDAVPGQKSGGKENTCEVRIATTDPEANEWFLKLKSLLQDVNSWKNYAPPGVELKLFDTSGTEKEGLVAEGDYIRISIPASGSADGSGYDWVKVTESGDRHDADNSSEIFWFTVHPSENPQDHSDDTAHFFDEETSNTFLAGRREKEVYAGVFGRNEQVNTNVSSVWSLIRDFVINIGARAGLSGVTWSVFVDGLLDEACGEDAEKGS